MKKIRFFVDGHVLNGQFHGTATFLEYLYKEIAEKNKNIEIVIGAYNYDYAVKLFQNYSNIQIVKYNSDSKLRFLVDIPRILKNQYFDYAHFQYVIPFYKPNNCKYIVTIHDILYKDFPDEFSFIYKFSRNIFFKYAAKKSDIITTVSEYSKRSIAKYFRIDINKIDILPIGISQDFCHDYDKNTSRDFVKKNLSIQNNYILYVSRIEPRKNHELLLQAYLDLQLWKENIDLVMVGKVYIKNQKYSELLNEIPQEAKKNIHLLENLSFDILFELYKSARMSVYPSKAEGFGIPIVESLALGIPTLFSNTTAMSEFKFAEKYFIDPFDLKSLRDKIRLELGNGIYSEKEQEAMKENICLNYNWYNCAKKLLNILREMSS